MIDAVSRTEEPRAPLTNIILNASQERTMDTCDLCEHTRMIIDTNITQYAADTRLATLKVCGRCSDDCVKTWSDENVQSLILHKLEAKAATTSPFSRL